MSKKVSDVCFEPVAVKIQLTQLLISRLTDRKHKAIEGRKIAELANKQNGFLDEPGEVVNGHNESIACWCGNQMHRLENQIEDLNRLIAGPNQLATNGKVTVNSLAQLNNKVWYFICEGADGEMVHIDKLGVVFAAEPESPIAKQMIDKSKGDRFVYNEKNCRISQLV